MTETVPSTLKLDFASPSETILSEYATEVHVDHVLNRDIQLIIDAMLNIANGEQGDASRKTMFGLAAPQVGVLKRIIILGIDSDGMGGQPELAPLVNPVCIESSQTKVAGREGCYSTAQVCGIVDRYESIKLSAYDRRGRFVSFDLEGFPARVAQHEVDHLNGIRFPDRITDPNHLHWVEEGEFGRYREEWENWATKCDRRQWESIKNGA